MVPDLNTSPCLRSAVQQSVTYLSCQCGVQEFENGNRLASHASATAPASNKTSSTAAEVISGPSGEQLSAISAALQGVQASMSGTLSQLQVDDMPAKAAAGSDGT